VPTHLIHAQLIANYIS